VNVVNQPGAEIVSPPAARRLDRRALVSRLMPVVVLIVLIGAVAAATPDFLSIKSLTTVADESSPIMILAAGETLVILMGGIDLSIAALASLATVLLARWLPGIGWPAIPLVILLTTLFGALQGYIHYKAQVPSFVVTLGGMGLWSGIALIASDASNISIKKGYDAIGWAFMPVFGLPSAFLIALTALVVLGAGMRWLKIGRWVSAIGNSEPAAILSGLPVRDAKVAIFAVSGFCAGLAGLVLASRSFSGAPSLADSLLLPSVAAIVIGGTAITGGFGGLGRTFVGALIITVMRVGIGLTGVDPAYEPISYGAIIMLAVALTLDRSKLSIVK